MASDNANTIQWQTRDSLPNAPESDSDAVVGCPMPLGFPLHGFREHTCHKGAGPKFTILNSLFTIQKGRHILPCVSPLLLLHDQSDLPNFFGHQIRHILGCIIVAFLAGGDLGVRIHLHSG